MPVLELRDIVKQFGAIHALNDVDRHLRPALLIIRLSDQADAPRTSQPKRLPVLQGDGFR